MIFRGSIPCGWRVRYAFAARPIPRRSALDSDLALHRRASKICWPRSSLAQFPFGTFPTRRERKAYVLGSRRAMRSHLRRFFPFAIRPDWSFAP